jgi:small subunit ribosomal protein S6
MRKYETIVIIKPSSTEEEIESIIERAKGIIEGDEGSFIKVDKWGLRKLAYPIKKEQQGYYGLLEFAAIPRAVTEMERIFKIDDRILKFMTIKLEHEYKGEAEVLEETASPADEAVGQEEDGTTASKEATAADSETAEA